MTVFERGEPRIYADVREARDDYDRDPVRSAMYLPVGDHGVLVLTDADVDAFEQPDIELVSVLSATAGTALDRLSHERELERQNVHLQQHIDLISHDLRNPLNVASGWLELVLEEQHSERLREVRAALDRAE